MKAKCINNRKIGYVDLEYNAYLTEGYIYEIQNHTEIQYLVFNNNKEWRPYRKVRFSEVIDGSQEENNQETSTKSN